MSRKELETQLAEAQTQRDNWRKTAKTKVNDLAKADAEIISKYHKHADYVEHHTLHNIASAVLFVALVVSVGFNIWG